MLRAAASLLDDPVDDVAAAWPRGAAVLIRQAIEATMEHWWTQTIPGMRSTNRAAQWVSLPSYLGDAAAVADANYSWIALSEACHHRGYDLGLTEPELRVHLASALRFASLVGAQLRVQASKTSVSAGTA